jgi:hypothetical protein
MQDPLPARHVILSQALAQARSPADIGGQLSLEKGAHFPPKCLLFGGVFQIHAR